MFTEYLKSPIGLIRITANEQNVTSIRVVDEQGEENANDATQACIKQLEEYFRGKRKHFDLPLEDYGTSFQQAVWQHLTKIGYGETSTYSCVAEAIGRPGAQRAVGSANFRNPFPIVVPCHRVVNKRDGLNGYAMGIEIKAWLLDHELKFRR